MSVINKIIECDDYTAEVEIEAYYDPNYGADADGNRGMPRTEINVAILGVWDIDGKEMVITKEIEKHITDLAHDEDLTPDEPEYEPDDR